jgi:hypothetical protein
MAHDRLMTDWMDALQDYPLSEVQSACREWVKVQPRKMPNEGDISKLILNKRSVMVERHKAQQPREVVVNVKPLSQETRKSVLEQAGFRVDENGRVVSSQ